MKKLTDEEVIKVLECCGKEYSCEKCILNTWLNKKRDCVGKILGNALDLINRQKAEIEGLIAGQETLQKGMAKKNAEVERLTKLALERHIHIYNLNEKIEELRKIRYLEVRAEAIKELAEMLCDGRVSNDPVVIAVKTELKLMEVEQ